MLYGPRGLRFEERPDPEIFEPTDAIIKLSAACVCGSDLWTYRGVDPVTKPVPMGHEYVSIVEEVGTQEAMMQSIHSTRPGGHVGFVGVLHNVEIPGEEFFFSDVHLHGCPAPVRRFLPELIDLIWSRKINPGKVFDLTLPLERVAEATARWMNAVRSRRCCARERKNHDHLDERRAHQDRIRRRAADRLTPRRWHAA